MSDAFDITQENIQTLVDRFDDNQVLSPAEMVSCILQSVTPHNLTEGENLFVGREPTDPADCVTVYDTGGDFQKHIVNYDEANFQVRVRNCSYREGYQISRQLKFTLQAIPCIIFPRTKIFGIWSTSNVAFIGRDTQERSLFTANYKLIESNDNPGNRNYVNTCI